MQLKGSISNATMDIDAVVFARLKRVGLFHGLSVVPGKKGKNTRAEYKARAILVQTGDLPGSS